MPGKIATLLSTPLLLYHRLRCAIRHRQVARWTPQQLGAAGERLAARYLQRQGMVIVARRHRQTVGEIDIVAVDQRRTLVFAEVKTRRGGDDLRPGESVTPRKQKRIARAAMRFIAEHHLKGTPLRFDVIAVVWPPNGDPPRLQHDRNAFPPPAAAANAANRP